MSHLTYLHHMIGDGATMDILTNKKKYKIGNKPERQGVYFFYLPALKARPARNLHITIPDNLNINRVHVTNGPVGSNDKTAYYSSSNHGEFIQRLQVVLGQEKREWEEYKLLKGSSLKFARYLQERASRRNELLEHRRTVREEAAQQRNRLQREARNKLQREAEAAREKQKKRNREIKAQQKLQRQAQEQLTRQLNQQKRVNQEKLEKFKKLALKTKRTEKQQSGYNSLRNLPHIKKFMAETTNNKYNFVRARLNRRAEAAGEAESRKENAAREKRNQNVEKEKKLLLNFDPRIPTQANFDRILRIYPELAGDINKAKSILRQINRWERGEVRLNNLNTNTIINFREYYYRKLHAVKGQKRLEQPEYHKFYAHWTPIVETLTKRETNMNELKQTALLCPAQVYNMLERPNTNIGLIKNALKNFPNNQRLREIYLQALRR